MTRSTQSREARRIALCRDQHGHPLCPYCDQRAKMVPITEVYDGKDYGKPDAKVWVCAPCNARVGCHGATGVPLGNLANPETREARIKAHAAFDPMWKAKMTRERCSKGKARGAGYKWLAEQMGIDPQFCHISWMDVEACEEVARICMNRGKPA